MEKMDTNPRHAANRIKLAIRLGDFLRANGKSYGKAATVAEMSDASWTLVAELSGERVPSEQTRACVVAYMEVMEQKDQELADMLVEAMGPRAARDLMRVVGIS